MNSIIQNTLAIDYGELRTGIAIGEVYELEGNLHTNIFPHQIIQSKNRQELISAIAKLINEYQIKQIVIGVLPLRVDGKKRRVTLMAEKLARQLNNLCHLPYFLIDESYTSVEAQTTITDDNSRVEIDSLCAQILLKNFMGSKDHKKIN